MDIALEIQLHLQRAVPVLKGEHGAPVQPEVGVQDLIIEEIGDALIIERFVGGEEQLHDLHGGLIRQTELAVRMGILTLIDRCSAKGVVGIFFVQPIVFIQNTHAFRLNGGDGAEQIPHDLKMVVHFTTAPHDIAHIGILPAITGTAGDRLFLENMNMVALHLAITNQIAGGGQCRQTGADDIGGLVIHTLRLLRTGKCFIVTTGIIHTCSSL